MPKFIVLEDNRAFRDYLCRILDWLGCEAVVLERGEGPQHLLHADYAGLVAGLYTVDRERVETILALRRMKPELPLIGLTWRLKGCENPFVTSLEILGASAILDPAFTPAEIVSAIRGVLPPSEDLVDESTLQPA